MRSIDGPGGGREEEEKGGGEIMEGFMGDGMGLGMVEQSSRASPRNRQAAMHELEKKERIPGLPYLFDKSK